jgi:hypothetical protein
MNFEGTFFGTWGPAEVENSRLEAENRETGDVGELRVCNLWFKNDSVARNEDKNVPPMSLPATVVAGFIGDG